MNVVLLGAITLALVTGLTLPSVVGATNDQVSPTEPAQVTNQINESGNNSSESPIQLFSIGNNWSGTASGSKQTSSSFVVPISFGHVKLYFNNKGTSSVIISVKHESSGLVYFTETVNAGKSLTWRSLTNYSQGMRSGTYTVTYRSSSTNVNVDFAGFASDNVEETKN